MPEEIAKKVEYEGVGMLTSWAPQQMILAHPVRLAHDDCVRLERSCTLAKHQVTSWFITHAGYNSLIESVVAGTPM